MYELVSRRRLGESVFKVDSETISESEEDITAIDNHLKRGLHPVGRGALLISSGNWGNEGYG